MSQAEEPNRAASPWAGLCREIPLIPEDFEAMDTALALVPELRLAALAIARARRLRLGYPIRSTREVAELLGEEGRLSAGGHDIDPDEIRRYLVPGELPIHNEQGLAAVVYYALQRCRRRQQLEQALRAFDEQLLPDPDIEVTRP
ncbi:hypothetical protein ACFUTV_43700 [Streptomyces sp. NPDC057298]|uniref:hypothetical protein n=1 Tax=Streptomyces sp. NPDC057298 TaxID=3346091 RepID=UPI00363D8DF0